MKANKTFFIIFALIVVGVGGYFWARSGFTLSVSRFFASQDFCNTQPYCSVNSIVTEYQDIETNNCIQQVVENCPDGTVCTDRGNGNASCEPTSTPTPVVTESTPTPTEESAPTPTATQTSEPTSGPTNPPDCDVHYSISHQNWQGGQCQYGIGDATVTLHVSDSGCYPMYIIANNFHGNQASCNATSEGVGGNADVQSANFSQPHSSGDVTISWGFNMFNCGTYQFDAAFRSNNGGDNIFIGEVVNMGKNCGATPTPTPSGTEETPTPTPTATPTPTPTPSSSTTPNPLACSPSSSSVAVGVAASFTATGGTGTYAWYALTGNPATGAGQTFAVSYTAPGSKTVIVASGANQASCPVTVNPTPTPTPSASASPSPSPSPSGTPTPTPSTTYSPTPTLTTPYLTLQKLVRNVTQNSGEVDNVNANPGDSIEFSLHISSTGSGPVISTVARDALPVGLTYVPGSTTIDGISAADGLVSSGLALGDLYPGRTITIRFRATTAPASFFAPGTSVLTNTGYARGSNVSEVSDTAFVTVISTPQSLSMSLTKMGMNTTRGETAEHSPVQAAPTQTIGFVLRVRNTSATSLTNVTLRDVVPQGITAIAGSVRIGGVAASDILTSSGLNIGTLVSGQEAVVTFSGRVVTARELPVGTTTLINTVQATADTVGMIIAQLPIIITNSAVVVPPISTGPGESTILALIISGIVTLLYVGYTNTNTYRRREVGEIIREAKKDTKQFDFRRPA